jgi:hypothetical protein
MRDLVQWRGQAGCVIRSITTVTQQEILGRPASVASPACHVILMLILLLLIVLLIFFRLWVPIKGVRF